MDKDTVKALQSPLDRAHVAQRSQAGQTLSYIEGWHAIAEANRIFGFGAWDRALVSCECVSQKERKIGRQQKDGWGVTYTARVRILVRHDGEETIREGMGAGHGIDVDLGQAHESAVKEAETDAMKRALMTFGNPFGLALYDKTQANVKTAPQRMSAAQAKREGLNDQIRELLNSSLTLEELDIKWQMVEDDHLPVLPLSWMDAVRDIYENKREELNNVGQ